MIPIEEYVAHLASLDVKLWLEEGKLRCNAPDQVFTQALKSELAARKPELMDFLARGARPGNEASIQPCPRDMAIPLTFGQERIWSLAKMEPASSVYNVPTVFMLEGALDVSALERALTGIQSRHEALRTVLPGTDVGSAHQEVLAGSACVLPVVPLWRDMGKLPPAQLRREISRILQGEVRKPFDLEKGPLWRARLFQLGPKRHLLAMTMHHIIFDGVSKALFLDELSESYKAEISQQPATISPPLVQFGDFAAWQRDRLDEGALARQMAYWTGRLEGAVPALATPNERPRSAGKGRAASVNFGLPEALCKTLQEFARREQASPFVVLLTVFDVLMNRHSGQEDLVVCSPMASRDHAQIEKVIGYFNNIVVMRADLSGNPSFRSLLGQVRRLALEAYDNQYIPLQHLAQLPNLVRTPLTRAMFSYQDASSRTLVLPGIKTKSVSVRKGAADFDLAMYVEREGEKIGGVLDYNADIFSAEMIKRLLQRFGQILSLALGKPDMPLSDFPAFGRKPANIETLLTKSPQIDQAVVVPDSRTGALNAYLVLNEHDVPSLDAVRAYAASALPDYKVPAAFIPLDEMPLLPDGRVDVPALPLPGSDRDRLKTPYVAPETELEKTLAGIWKKVLWLDHEVGIKDHFRDLGGHSLLSVQLVVEIEKTLGRPVPARALSRLDTIETFARLLESPDTGDEEASRAAGQTRLPQDTYHGLRSHTASWEGKRTTPESVMVGLNTDGTQQGLFWCLQRYQELTQLAKYLGPDQPVYGMRSGNRVMVKTQDSVNLLASHYVDEILATQPSGPYLIGGNCQAAQIAFQIASQLIGLGHEISLLILHEKFVPYPYPGPVALLFGDKSMYNPYHYFKWPELGWRKYYSGPVSMGFVSGSHGQFFREPNVQVLTQAIQDKIRQASHADFDGWSVSSPGGAVQCLTEEAYRAQLSGPGECRAVAGELFSIEVQVRNVSTVPWQASAVSGLFLANCWRDKAGKVTTWLDGRVGLPCPLEPSASVNMRLEVRAPDVPGEWVLELDMVDEGVTWFKEQGSTPLRVACSVDARP